MAKSPPRGSILIVDDEVELMRSALRIAHR